MHRQHGLYVTRRRRADSQNESSFKLTAMPNQMIRLGLVELQYSRGTPLGYVTDLILHLNDIGQISAGRAGRSIVCHLHRCGGALCRGQI